MTTQERMRFVADRYRSLGFKVVASPGPDDLPPFAKGFKVDLVATSDKDNVLVVAKDSPSALQADKEVERYAEVASQQPGWRLDLFVLGPESPPLPDIVSPKEPTEEESRRFISDAERMLQAGFPGPAFLAAWACLESAMRRRLEAEDGRARWGTSSRTLLNELFSAGAFDYSEFRELERLAQLQGQIVHGFSVPHVPPSTVEFLLRLVRRLLTESQPAKMTA